MVIVTRVYALMGRSHFERGPIAPSQKHPSRRQDGEPGSPRGSVTNISSDHFFSCLTVASHSSRDRPQRLQSEIRANKRGRRSETATICRHNVCTVRGGRPARIERHDLFTETMVDGIGLGGHCHLYKCTPCRIEPLDPTPKSQTH